MWSREQTVVQSEWWVSTQDIYMFVWLKYHNVALVHLALLSLAESLHFNLNKIWQVNLIGLMTSVFSQTASLECTAKVIHNLNLLSVKKKEEKILKGRTMKGTFFYTRTWPRLFGSSNNLSKHLSRYLGHPDQSNDKPYTNTSHHR